MAWTTAQIPTFSQEQFEMWIDQISEINSQIMGHYANNIKDTANISPDVCNKWLDQISKIKSQIMDHYELSNDRECISDQVSAIVNSLDILAISISEILKHLNNKCSYNKHNN